MSESEAIREIEQRLDNLERGLRELKAHVESHAVAFASQRLEGLESWRNEVRALLARLEIE